MEISSFHLIGKPMSIRQDFITVRKKSIILEKSRVVDLKILCGRGEVDTPIRIRIA